MKLKKGICIILLFFFCQLEAKVINPILKHYNMNNGLVDNYVTAIHQDQQGYIWIGTRLGVNRFDGYQFKTYGGNIDNVRIRSMSSDNNGNLFLATTNGLFVYDREHDNFKAFDSLRVESENVSLCKFDQDNYLWTIDMNGVIRSYGPEFEYLESYTSDSSLGYTDFCIDRNNQLWLCDYFGNLLSLDRVSGKKKSYYLFKGNEKELSHKLYRLVPSDYSDKIYVAYEKDDVKIFHTKTKSYEDINIQKHYGRSILINDIIEVSEDIIWIGTNMGVIIYDIKRNEYSEITYSSSNSYSLQSQGVRNLFQDNEGNIWMGSHQNGISYYSSQQFDILYPSDNDGSIACSVICDIRQDNYGNIWVASEDNGISVLDKSTGEFVNYTNLPYLDICSITIHDNKLWICYYIHGLESYNLKGEKLKSYVLGTREAMVNNHMYALQTLSDGTLLVATANGLFKYIEDQDEFVFIQEPISGNQYYTIKEDSIDGRVWYAGFYCNLNDLKSGQNRFSNQYSFNSDELNNDFVIDMTNDCQGNAWYLFRRAGIVKYDREKKQSIKMTGLEIPANQLLRIVADNNDKVWISSMSGLVCVGINDGKVIVYNDAHGLLTKQFNYRAALKDSEGELYFGTNMGVVRLSPESFFMQPNKTHVYVTSIDYYDRKKNIVETLASHSIGQEVSLDYFQNTFDIYLSTLSYQRLGAMRFAYQLNKNGWTDVHSNMISFIGLAPGSYLLTIKVLDNNGEDVTETPLRIKLRIQSPWWSSNLAYILYSIVILGFAFIQIQRYRKKQKLKLQQQLKDYEIEKEKELYQTKINFFYNIAHEIRTPVTLVKTPLEHLIKYAKICDRGYKSLLMMDRNVDRLLNLVNQLLNFRSAENQGGSQLCFRHEDVSALLSSVIELFHDTMESEGRQLNISLPEGSLYADVDREAFGKILFNLLSNAVKYGEHMVSVCLSKIEKEDVFYIDVSNDGIHIPSEDYDKIFEPFYRNEEASHVQGTGLGLSLTKFLVTLHNGSIQLIESNDVKTTFRVILPLHQENVLSDDKAGEVEEPVQIGSLEKEGEGTKLYTALVVEDDKEMGLYIVSLLAPLYNVQIAQDGKQAMEIIKGQSVHLVISDVLMPIMDGYELLKAIKSDENICHIPVILLTAKSSIPERLKGIEMGADAYIDKPFSADVLLAQASNLIANRESIRKFYFKSPFANMKAVNVSKEDEGFLDSLNNVINEHLDDVDLSVNSLADYMNMSRASFYRRVNAISNTSPNDLVRIARLKKAAELLLTTDMKIYEVSEAVGFRSQSYFWSSFIKHFGLSPSKYAKVNRNQGPKRT